MAAKASSTCTSARALYVQRLLRGLTQLEALQALIIAELDELEGDPDFENCSEDEGAQCEDEGGEVHHVVPHYGLDQTLPLGGIFTGPVRLDQIVS